MNQTQRSRDSARLAAARNALSRSAQLRAANRAAEHRHLVAEDGVLGLDLTHTRASVEESDQANELEVHGGSRGARMPPAGVNHPGNQL